MKKTPRTPTAAEIIKSLGKSPDVAAALGLAASTVRTMAYKNSIRPEHWPALIALARKRGVRLNRTMLIAADAKAVAERRRNRVKKLASGGQPPKVG